MFFLQFYFYLPGIVLLLLMEGFLSVQNQQGKGVTNKVRGWYPTRLGRYHPLTYHCATQHTYKIPKHLLRLFFD